MPGPRSALRPSTRGHPQPKEPTPQTRFWLPARPRVGFPTEPHLVQEDETQYYFHHRTGKTQRLGRGEAFVAGVRGRGCRSAIVLLPELSRGLVSPIGAGPEPTDRTVHQRERWVVGKPGSADECVCWALLKLLTGRSPQTVSPRMHGLKTSVREVNESCFLPRKKKETEHQRRIKAAPRAVFREELTG